MTTAIQPGHWIQFSNYEHPNPNQNSCISDCKIMREFLGHDWRRVAEVFPDGGGPFRDGDIVGEERIPFLKVKHGSILSAHIPLSAICGIADSIPKDEELLVIADAIATDAHFGQWRKFQPAGERVRYKIHLDRMDRRLLQAGILSPIVRAASKCHDVIEDAPGFALQIARDLGPEVFALVHQLTNPSKRFDGTLNRARRKEIDREHLRRVSTDAVAIKLADLADNASDVGGAERDFKRLFLEESNALLAVLLARLDQCPGGKYGYLPHRRLIIECEKALEKLASNLEADR